LGPGDVDTLNVFITPGTGGAFNAGTDTEDIALEQWEHAAFVADPATELVTLYRNGVVVAEQPYDGSFTTSPVNTALGIGVKTNDAGDAADPGCCAAYWNGKLDDLGLWLRALSSDEVAQIYQNGLAGMPILGGATVPGDFDGDGALTAADIDQLSAEVRSGANTPAFDLNGDAVVDNKDRVQWVEQLKRTYFGDANLDGEFNSTDFVHVFQRGEYEDGVAANSTWEDGDWTGDGEFDSTDFVNAFQSGGYELGPRPAAAAVPEPGSAWLLLGGLLSSAAFRRRGIRGTS
jgi:hypothetical protein